ncbi:MAG: acetate--CoA ligase [Gammaproteobacteria bacterium]
MPNLEDYQRQYREFTWQAAAGELAGLPQRRGLNMAYEAVDRHAADGNGERVALRWLSKTGQTRDYTYGQLQRLSNRFANALRALGIGKGDRVCTLTGRIPALYIAALGTLKTGSVYCPLFTAYGPDPIKTRLEQAKARLLVTTAAIYARKVAPLVDSLPHLRHVIVVGESTSERAPSGTHDFDELLKKASDTSVIGSTAASDWALVHFTSGTTGTPKGAIHGHGSVIAHHSTAKFALDLRPEDVFWCTADPGWITGTVYGIFAPLAVGATLLADEADFDWERWCHVLSQQGVAVWYTTPTAARLMRRLGTASIRRHPMPQLRFLATVGEPLHPETVSWSQEAFGRPFHDNWWQTETGAIMIANFASVDIKPGSMGNPIPGIDATVVRRLDENTLETVPTVGEVGELALRIGWPSMFQGYLEDDARFQRCFAQGWYLSGDLVRRDEDGYFWFVGRADEVIKTSGHLIGPLEVETVLMAHPAVAETAVVGVPDPVALEVVKAFVVLNPGHTADDTLRRQLLAYARAHLGPGIAPRIIDFRPDLPKTNSGKIRRRQLRAERL